MEMNGAILQRRGEVTQQRDKSQGQGIVGHLRRRLNTLRTGDADLRF